MQDNVDDIAASDVMAHNDVSPKRKIVAFTAALTVFAVLLIIHTIFRTDLIEPNKVEKSSEIDNHLPMPNENDEIKYIGCGFTVSDYTKTAARGDMAYVEVLAAEDADIGISVYYGYGKSQSEVFCSKQVECGESAIWKWIVPNNTTVSMIRIVLRSDTSYATLNISVP